jgi:vacuolar-type H+-ATPase subunit H
MFRQAVNEEKGIPMEETLEHILSIEAEAKTTVSEAQKAATMLKEQSEKEADQTLAQARQEAEKEAEALREKVRQEMEEEKARILSQTAQELRHLEEKANFEKAVNHVVKVLSGQEEG